jgi:ribosomal protein L22
MKQKIHHTVYKLVIVAKLINGLQLYEAQNILNNISNKKSA